MVAEGIVLANLIETNRVTISDRHLNAINGTLRNGRVALRIRHRNHLSAQRVESVHKNCRLRHPQLYILHIAGRIDGADIVENVTEAALAPAQMDGIGIARQFRENVCHQVAIQQLVRILCIFKQEGQIHDRGLGIVFAKNIGRCNTHVYRSHTKALVAVHFAAELTAGINFDLYRTVCFFFYILFKQGSKDMIGVIICRGGAMSQLQRNGFYRTLRSSLFSISVFASLVAAVRATPYHGNRHTHGQQKRDDLFHFAFSLIRLFLLWLPVFSGWPNGYKSNNSS